MHRTPAQITEVIETVVRERFDGAPIEAVRVEAEIDYDGVPVVRVTVIFDAKKGSLDAHKTAGITRHIRHRLLAEDEDAFPIFAFVSKSDAARITAAA